MDSIALDRVTVASPAIKPDLRRHWRRVGLAAALLTAASGIAWYAQDWWRVGRFIESTDDAYVGGNVTPLAPHIDAFIERVLVTDNERVAAEWGIEYASRPSRRARGRSAFPAR